MTKCIREEQLIFVYRLRSYNKPIMEDGPGDKRMRPLVILCPQLRGERQDWGGLRNFEACPQ